MGRNSSSGLLRLFLFLFFFPFCQRRLNACVMILLTVQLFTLNKFRKYSRQRKSLVKIRQEASQHNFSDAYQTKVQVFFPFHYESKVMLSLKQLQCKYFHQTRESLPHELAMDDFFLPVYLVTRIKVNLYFFGCLDEILVEALTKRKEEKKAFKSFLLIDFFVFLRFWKRSTTTTNEETLEECHISSHASEDEWERINKLFK